jgi:hypothetical protein
MDIEMKNPAVQLRPPVIGLGTKLNATFTYRFSAIWRTLQQWPMNGNLQQTSPPVDVKCAFTQSGNSTPH